MRLTLRDAELLRWFEVVRLTNMEGLRWVLAGANGSAEPVSLRAAQAWVKRMESAGLVDRALTVNSGGSVVWATKSAIDKSVPTLLSQTTRHEVAVSMVAARYAAAGYSWARDRQATNSHDHQGDGIAVGNDARDLIEIELTSKRRERYFRIFAALKRRIDAGEISQITYYCTKPVATTLHGVIQEPQVWSTIGPHLRVLPVFDLLGIWSDDRQPPWLRASIDPRGSLVLDNPPTSPLRGAVATTLAFPEQPQPVQNGAFQ